MSRVPIFASPPASAERAGRLRRDLNTIVLAWVFGAFWMWTISGAVFTRFARELDTPDWAFGLFASVPYVATLFQLPASYLLERFGRRKALFMVSLTLSRLLWALLATVPWLFPESRRVWWPAMMTLLLLSWSLAHLGTPAWMDWMADVVPRSVRGRFFGWRNRIGQMIGLIASLGIGWVLDLVERSQGHDLAEPGLMLRVTSVILAVAGLTGVLDIQCFNRIADPPRPRPTRHEPYWNLVRQALRDKQFVRYLLFNITFTLGIGFIGQYVWLYGFDVLDWSNQQANTLMIVLPLIVMMAGYGMWGRLGDRVGRKPTLIIASLLTALAPLGWVLAQPGHFWFGFVLVQLGVFGWPGVELTNSNMLMDMAGSRDGRRGGTAYVAITSVAAALAGIVSGLLAGLIAGVFEGSAPWTFEVAAFPGGQMQFTYHSLLFGLAALFRIAAVVYVLPMPAPRQTDTRDVIRFMTEDFYANIRQAALAPDWVVGQVRRWTYKLGKR